MNRINSVTKPLAWFMTLLLVALAAGCGGAGQSPILGGGGAGAILGAPAGAVIPGACLVPGPKVTTSDPLNGNLSVTTSTTGVAGNGKKITANFDTVMDPATINATTFKLAIVGGVALVPASVSYSALAATFTTAVPLLANTSYLAVITVGAKSATAIPLSCSYAWTFKTAPAPAAAPASVNLGLAAPFGIAATAGIANTVTAPATTIHGDVILDPTLTCNTVAVPGGANTGSAGFGVSGTACGGVLQTPVLDATASVIITGAAASAIKADLNAAYLSITPPAGPPAAGSLGGATSLPAGTTLGAVTGSAMVQGDNYFVPGVYQSITSILITGDLTLDALGDPNARFVFQSSSTIGTADGAAPPGSRTRILLVGGAKASNVWWQAGSSATLGTQSEFNGNILAAFDITMKTGATSCGRLMAGAWVGGTGAFIFDSNVVSVPGNANAPLCL